MAAGRLHGVLLLAAACCAAQDQPPTAVATFASMGLYWDRPGDGAADNACRVRYRETGARGWREAQPLWFDHKIRQYRGSVVHLDAGRTYEFELRLDSGAASAVRQSTWPDAFPVGAVTRLPRGRQPAPYRITRGGRPGAWRVYRGHPRGTIFDAAGQADHCVVVEADYVILRGIACRGARIHGILIRNRHDVVIEESDISGWGRKETLASTRPYAEDLGVHLDSGIATEGPDVERIVIQGNRVHHPRYRSSNWTEWSPYFKSSHPQGPKAVLFGPPTKGNHVVRYNDFYSDADHMFNDILFEAIGGPRGRSPGNGLVTDSDVYGNVLTDCWDDAIEVERGDRNVRVWGNYFSRIFKSISAGWVWDGPVYIWRNVTDVKLEPHKQGKGVDTMERRVAALLMPQQEPAAEGNSTVIYLYHNTVLCPPGQCDSLAAGNGYQDYTSEFTRLVSRNNILQTEEWAVPGLFTFYRVSGRYLSEDYDLHNGAFDSPEMRGPHSIQGQPVFRTGHGGGDGGRYQLAAGSPGHDVGVRLPNFNDDFHGRAPDIGAHEHGGADMVFGTKAWKRIRKGR